MTAAPQPTEARERRTGRRAALQGAALLAKVNATLRRRSGTTSAGGDELTVGCLEPNHEDRHPSASWNIREGCGRCHACGAGWSTKRAAELLGIGVATNGRQGQRETAWEIRDRAGELVARHHRVDRTDSSKMIWWTGPNREKKLGRPASSLPLYLTERLDSYKHSEPVYVVEGEKAADAAVRLGLQAVGSVTGASSCPGGDVLASLHDFSVVLWPDYDKPGADHMQKVGAALKGDGAELVGMVDVEKLWAGAELAGQDAADLAALPEGGLPIVAADRDACDAPPSTRISASPVPLAELLAQKMPPREWLLEGMIQERDLGMIHAYRGVGKSRFAHAAGMAVASGGRFLRFEAPTARGVLLVDGELPREDLQKMLAQAVAASDAEPVAPFNVLSADLVGDPLPSLATEAGQEIVGRHLDGVSLLILDNISTLFAGSGPENDAESWERAQAWLLNLRRRGVAVLLVHHDGKGGAQRGTSRREDVLSQVVQLRRPPDYTPSQGAVFQIHFTKSRGLVGPDADPFEATMRTDQDGRPVWTWKAVEDATAARAQEMQELGMSQREIASELGVNQSTVSRALKRVRAGDAAMQPPGDASAHHGQGGA